jgi:rhodanese-related sulfurtransferase
MKASITLAELKQLLRNKTNMVVLDVRDNTEYNDQHIPFATNIPITAIEAGNYIPEPGRIIVTACGKGGGRSEKAADLLRDMSTNDVYYLEGGTFEWMENEN